MKLPIGPKRAHGPPAQNARDTTAPSDVSTRMRHSHTSRVLTGPFYRFAACRGARQDDGEIGQPRLKVMLDSVVAGVGALSVTRMNRV